jgi:tetratricopeptide (TPR) repeat protein
VRRPFLSRNIEGATDAGRAKEQAARVAKERRDKIEAAAAQREPTLVHFYDSCYGGAAPETQQWLDPAMAETYALRYADAVGAGAALFARGRVVAAIGAYSQALAAMPKQEGKEAAELLRMLGQCHAESDNDIAAIECLKRATAADPGALTALVALAVSCVPHLRVIVIMMRTTLD